MSESTSCFVQFPHPGKEHVPTGTEMAWNLGDHGRKFLKAAGRYVDADDHSGTGELTLWGEWEPPSRVIKRWLPSGHLPRALHHPYWFRPPEMSSRQNTDPWVWGQRMTYSVCKQVGPLPYRRSTSMQTLPRGSVICFGSQLDGQFCIDTVFVVACAERWVPANVGQHEVSEAFAICTAGAVTACGTDAHTKLTLYRGATFEDPVDGMYSFAPAALADSHNERFGRPPLDMPGFVNPESKQSTRGSKKLLPSSTVRQAWWEVRRQVLEADLLLATRLATPPEALTGNLPVGANRVRC